MYENVTTENLSLLKIQLMKGTLQLIKMAYPTKLLKHENRFGDIICVGISQRILIRLEEMNISITKRGNS